MKKYIVTEKQLERLIMYEQSAADIKTIELNIGNNVKRKFTILIDSKDKEGNPKTTILSIQNKNGIMVPVSLEAANRRANLIKAIPNVDGTMDIESISGRKDTLSRMDLNGIFNFIDNPNVNQHEVSRFPFSLYFNKKK